LYFTFSKLAWFSCGFLLKPYKDLEQRGCAEGAQLKRWISQNLKTFLFILKIIEVRFLTKCVVPYA
jgi:hypothetical protein